jgi:hypothetical protein
MAIGSAAAAPSFAAFGFAVRTFLAPNLYFFFFSALDASLAHFPVVLDLCLRELTVLPEYDVEAQAEYAERHKH